MTGIFTAALLVGLVSFVWPGLVLVLVLDLIMVDISLRRRTREGRGGRTPYPWCSALLCVAPPWEGGATGGPGEKRKGILPASGLSHEAGREGRWLAT